MMDDERDKIPLYDNSLDVMSELKGFKCPVCQEHKLCLGGPFTKGDNLCEFSVAFWRSHKLIHEVEMYSLCQTEDFDENGKLPVDVAAVAQVRNSNLKL